MPPACGIEPDKRTLGRFQAVFGDARTAVEHAETHSGPALPGDTLQIDGDFAAAVFDGIV
jgi:hypothetical protein